MLVATPFSHRRESSPERGVLGATCHAVSGPAEPRSRFETWLSFVKPDIKEFCKTVKQHPRFSQFIFALENSYFHKDM